MNTNKRKTLTGKVVSDKMDKTIVVSVTRTKKFGMFGKTVKVTKKYKAHDEKNECGIGDQVTIEECRPLSKEKRWRMIAILGKAPGVGK